MLERLELNDKQIEQLNERTGKLLRQHSDAVARLAEIPGLRMDSAQQIIAEVGPAAAVLLSGC